MIIKKDNYLVVDITTSKDIKFTKDFEEINSFYSNVARIKQKDKYAFINKEGLIVSNWYTYASDFKDNYAIIKNNNLYGLINRDFREVIPCIYDQIYIIDKALLIAKKNNKVGIIDTNNNIIIDFIYDSIKHPSQSLFGVLKNNKYGFIDINNNTIIPNIYDSIEAFSSSLAKVKKDNKTYFIDKNNNMVIKCEKYNYVSSFTKTFAKVLKNGKWGLIDKTNKEILPPLFDSIWDINNGLIRVLLNKKYYFIDENANIKISSLSSFDYVSDFKNNYALVKQNKKYGLINTKGNIIIPTIYDYLEIINNNLLKAGINNKIGLIDIKQNIIIPYLYNHIDYSDNLLRLENELGVGFCTIEGYNKVFKNNNKLIAIDYSTKIDNINNKKIRYATDIYLEDYIIHIEEDSYLKLKEILKEIEDTIIDEDYLNIIDNIRIRKD